MFNHPYIIQECPFFIGFSSHLSLFIRWQAWVYQLVNQIIKSLKICINMIEIGKQYDEVNEIGLLARWLFL